jgi:hypothetical protein
MKEFAHLVLDFAVAIALAYGMFKLIFWLESLMHV